MAVFNRNNVVSARVCSTANFSLKYVYAFPCTRRCGRSVPWFHRVSSPALVLRESPYSGGHASIVSDSQCCSCIHGINALFLPTVYCRHTMRLVVSYYFIHRNQCISVILFILHRRAIHVYHSVCASAFHSPRSAVNQTSDNVPKCRPK